MNERIKKAFNENYAIQFTYYLVASFVVNFLFNAAGLYDPRHSIERLAVQSLISAISITAMMFIINKYKNKKG